MKGLRFIALTFGWVIMGLSVAIFMAATGIGWIGEHFIRAGIET